jgi:Mg-chelatase subunit ChlD
MFSASRDADIRMYFTANFPAGFLGAAVNGPTIQVDAAGEIINLAASATVPTTFMKVLGIDTMRISSATEVTRQTQLLDLVLAIDMSGSMSSSAGGQTRIAAARSAATALVSILFGQDSIKNLLKIGLVPWNAKVNVMLRGAAYDPALTVSRTVPIFTNPVTGTPQTTLWYASNSPAPLLAPPASTWQGCVYARYLDNAATDDDADVLEGDYSSPAGDWVGWQPIGPEGEPVPGFARCTSAIGFSECTPCLSHGITPLQSTRQGILYAINELVSPRGTTDAPQGLAWAWRVLTPPKPFEEANPNPPGRRQQAIVLLTDGENVGGSGDAYKGVFGTGSAAQAALDDRLRVLAANIKSQGVKIYTIQFANNGTAMQQLLKEVASGTEAPYYNYAPDAATLQQIFREVANHLSELRLSR